MINYYIVYRCCNWACAYAKPINGRESLLSFAQVFAAAEPDFFFGGLLAFWSLLFLLHEGYLIVARYSHRYASIYHFLFALCGSCDNRWNVLKNCSILIV